MALIFPANPSVGDLYPVDPGTSGVTQYRWDGSKWSAVLSTVSLGNANQGAYNEFTWPADAPGLGDSLTALANGSLTWGTVDSQFPKSIFDPVGGLTTVNGISEGIWNGPTATLTSTGCISVSIEGDAFITGNQTVNNGELVRIKFVDSPSCGSQATGTTLTGTLTDGTNENIYTLTISRIPNPNIEDIFREGVEPNATVAAPTILPISGITNTAYVTYVSTASTGANIHASLDGVNYTQLFTSGTSFPINNGDTLYISQQVGPFISTDYTATIRVGDGSNISGTYDEFVFTASTLAVETFPGTNFSPSFGPTASPSTVNIASQGLFGEATATWGSGSTTLTATGDLQLKVNAGVYTNSSPIADGDFISIIWNPNSVIGAGDGDTLSGSLTNGTFTSTFSLLVDRSATGFVFRDNDGEAPNNVATSDIITPRGFNVPLFLSFPDAGSTLASAGVSVSGGVFFGAGPLTVNPGDTLQCRGTTGATLDAEYVLELTLGTGATTPATTTWTVTTANSGPTITQPRITTPNDGATDVDPTHEFPAGVTLGATAYQPLNGAGGTQTSATYEVYDGGYPLTSSSTITGVGNEASGDYSEYVAVPRDTATLTAGDTVFYVVEQPLINRLWAFSKFLNNLVTYYSDDNGFTWILNGRNAGTAFETRGTYLNYGVNRSTGRLLRLSVAANIGGAYNVTNGLGTFGITQNFPCEGIACNNLSNWVSAANSPDTIYYSVDDGTQWTRVENVPAGLPSTTCKPVWDEANNRFLIVGNGISIRSSNLFVWVNTSSAPNMGADVVAGAAAYGGGVILVGEDREGGFLYRSTDGGDTWTQIDTGIANARFGRGSLTTDNSGNWWASFAGTTTLARSVDNGLTWEEITIGDPEWTSSQQASYLPTSRAVAVAGTQNLAFPGVIFERKPLGDTLITIANAATDGFRTGLTIRGDTSLATGIVLSVDNTKITTTTGGGLFVNGENISIEPSTYFEIPSSPINVLAPPYTSTQIPGSEVDPGRLYFARVKYGTTNAAAATSDFSPWSSFEAASFFNIEAGTFIFGGGYAGQVLVDGIVYNLIAWPGRSGALYGRKKLSTSRTTFKITQSSWVYGGDATFNNATSDYPWFDFICNDPTGPNGGTVDLTNSIKTGTSGYNDWYMPSQYEAQNIYYFLKPKTQNNSTSTFTAFIGPLPTENFSVGYGFSPISQPPYDPNTSWTATGAPFQTAASDWQEGGQYALDTASYYWTVTDQGSWDGDATVVNIFYYLSGGARSISNIDFENYANFCRRQVA